MAQLLYAQTNYFTTNLTTTNGIDATQTTGIILNDVSGLYDLSKPSIIALDWVKNADGTLDTTNLEYIEVTSIDPSTKECQGVTRGVDGFAAKAHDFGAVIVFPVSRSTINRLADLTQSVLATKVNIDGWIPILSTLTYASSTTMNTSVDLTAYIQVKDLIVITQSSTLKYFEVTEITSSLITVKGIGTNTVASSTISNPAYFHQYPMGVTQSKSLVRAYNNATFVTTTATETQIPFNTEFFDTNSEYDTSTYTFTAKKAGYYLVNVSIIYIEGTISSATLTMKLNGNYSKSTASALAAAYSGMNFSDIIYLEANDALTFYTLQLSGSNKTVHSDQGACYMSIAEL